MQKFNSFITEAKDRKSLFDPSISVVVYYPKDWEYIVWKPQFDELGWAIGVMEHKIIVWDGVALGKLTKAEIEFVEAHECSHFQMPHASEAECDWLAIAKLWKKGMKDAAQVGIDKFVERHGAQFDTDDLPGYDKWISTSKKLGEEFIEECKDKNIDILQALKNPQKYNLNPTKRSLKEAWNIYTESIIKN